MSDRLPRHARIVILGGGLMGCSTAYHLAREGVDAPLHACEHHALITKPYDGIYPGMPIQGDHDGNMYLRDEGGGLMVGCFEPAARPVDREDLPEDFAFDLLAEHWDQFEPVMGGAIHRIPALETAEATLDLTAEDVRRFARTPPLLRH